MKTTIKTFALLLAIFIIAFINIDAQAGNITFTQDAEDELEIEGWMVAPDFGLDQTHFDFDRFARNPNQDFKAKPRPFPKDIHAAIFAFNRSGFKDFPAISAEEPDDELTIESWMTNDSLWDGTSTIVSFKQENEQDLSIEGWMTEDYFWNNSFAGITQETDSDLGLEPWMTDETYWR